MTHLTVFIEILPNVLPSLKISGIKLLRGHGRHMSKMVRLCSPCGSLSWDKEPATSYKFENLKEKDAFQDKNEEQKKRQRLVTCQASQIPYIYTCIPLASQYDLWGT
jgi:hypothetical protein